MTSDYIMYNALRMTATKCKEEMEATKNLAERRSIIDRHLAPLKLKFGLEKIDLQGEIYAITKGL